MDTRCNGSTDNCTECHLTTIHCLFLIDVSLIRDCCERNTKKHDRSKNIQYKDQSACTYTNTVHIPTCSLSGRPSNANRSSKNYMVNSSFAWLHFILRLTINLAIHLVGETLRFKYQTSRSGTEQGNTKVQRLS